MNSCIIGESSELILECKNPLSSPVSECHLRASGISPNGRAAAALSCGTPGIGLGMDARYSHVIETTTSVEISQVVGVNTAIIARDESKNQDRASQKAASSNLKTCTVRGASPTILELTAPAAD